MIVHARWTYVRRPRSDKWHFAANCSRLPRAWVHTIRTNEEPENGGMCSECVSKEERGVALPIIEAGT